MCSLPKSNPTIKGDNSKCIFFFKELCPFFDSDILSSIKHAIVEHCMRCSCCTSNLCTYASTWLIAVWRRNDRKAGKYLLLTHYHTLPHFDALRYIAVGKILRKGEIACNKQFLPFSQCFLLYVALIFRFKCILKCHLHFFFFSIWTNLNFYCLVMG